MRSAMRWSLFVAIGLIVGPPVGAQQWGELEVGGFGKYTVFDASYGVQDWPGFGGRLGLFVLPRLELEGDISRTLSSAKRGAYEIMHVPIHARLIYNQPVGSVTNLLIGGGYVRNKYTRAFTGSDNGVSGLLGVRVKLSDWFAVRFDVSADYMSSPANKQPGVSDNWHGAATGGLSFMIGGRAKPKREPPVRVAPEPTPPPVTPVVDSDNDGVADTADKCPNTPAGTQVDAVGCPVPQDADHDGVVDSMDKCPGTPVGTKVDASGCPLDSDGDGVPDVADKCPDTPAGTRVDANGCPVIFEEKKTAVVLRGVNFELNKAVLLSDARDVLDQVAASLVANPDVRVEVAGYTDNSGSRAYNMKLSQARAEAVRTYLVQKGVPANQLTAKGYGPDNPVASNRTSAGRAQNRRVELHKLS